MTRETKIGLLVGLAFIIVIGILLSDQLMRSTEPPAAPRADAGDSVRRGTTTPAPQHRAAAPAVSTQDASPDNMVPTRAEITRPGPPVTFVNVGPGVSNGAGTVVVGGNDGNRGQVSNAVPPGAVDVRQVGNNGYDTGTHAAGGAGGRSLADEAARVGETLVGPDGQPLRANTPLPPVVVNNGNGGQGGGPARTQQPLTGGMKQYKAEVGDSLSKLALKQMGSNSKANRDAIVKANPSLAADPNKIIIGVTYNIPAAVAATPAVAGGNVTPPVVVPAAPRAPEHAATASVAENVYVVQSGDNLSRIAKDHMGDITTIAAIKELNKDLVKNWDVLPVGTKLRLPGKPLASAN